MDEQDYIEKRLDDQAEWYNRKSMWNQKRYKRFKVISLALAASVPVAIPLIDSFPWVKIIIAVAGATTAIITGTFGVYKFQENWIQYRIACEALKREKYLFLTKCGVYENAVNSLSLLVERTEDILLNENACWTQTHQHNTKNHTNTPLTGVSSSTGS